MDALLFAFVLLVVLAVALIIWIAEILNELADTRRQLEDVDKKFHIALDAWQRQNERFDYLLERLRRRYAELNKEREK